MRTFYILAITQIFSLIGSGMTGFALGIRVFTDTGDTTPLLLVSFFTLLPYMFGGSLAGVVADRFSRKRLIILGDTGQAIPTLLLAISFLTNQFELWQLYLAMVVQASFSLLQSPALSASIVMIVDAQNRDRANAIMQIASPAAGMVAPILAGTLYGVLDVAGIMLADLATFVFAVVVISFIQIPQPTASEEGLASKGSIWSELKGGFQFLTTRRGLFILTLYFTFLNFVTEGVFRLFTPYLLLLTGSESAVGILQGIASLGLVAGGLVTTVWRGTHYRINTILPALMWAGIGMAIFGIVRDPLPLAIIMFLMMLPYKMTNALLVSVMQAKIPPDMQGRVFALSSQLSVFAMPLTFLITGPIVDRILEPAVGGEHWQLVEPIVGNAAGAGIGLYAIICGMLLLIATVVVYALPSVRHMERDLPDYTPTEQLAVSNEQSASTQHNPKV